MPTTDDKRDGAVYHTILSDMHRVQSSMLSLQTLDNPETAEALREYFERERSVALGRLREWQQRRPDIFRRAGEAYRRESQQ